MGDDYEKLMYYQYLVGRELDKLGREVLTEDDLTFLDNCFENKVSAEQCAGEIYKKHISGLYPYGYPKKKEV